MNLLLLHSFIIINLILSYVQAQTGTVHRRFEYKYSFKVKLEKIPLILPRKSMKKIVLNCHFIL